MGRHVHLSRGFDCHWWVPVCALDLVPSDFDSGSWMSFPRLAFSCLFGPVKWFGTLGSSDAWLCSWRKQIGNGLGYLATLELPQIGCYGFWPGWTWPNLGLSLGAWCLGWELWPVPGGVGWHPPYSSVGLWILVASLGHHSIAFTLIFALCQTLLGVGWWMDMDRSWTAQDYLWVAVGLLSED